MNWGGFAGGLSQGFNNGIQIGKTINAAIKEKRLEDIRAQGIAEAKAMQEKAVADSVRENEPSQPGTPATAPTALNTAPQTAEPSAPAAPAPAPDQPAQPAAPAPAAAPNAMDVKAVTTASMEPPAPPVGPAAGLPAPAKRFSVGNMGFDTRDEAMAHARKSTPTIMDFMSKTLVPKMQEELVAQGDIEKAEAWGKWAKDKENQQRMETWGKAYKAMQVGDVDTAAKHFFKLYQDYDDGVTPLSHEAVKDKEGNITGFNGRLKTDATGEERSQFIDKGSLTEMGLSALSPPALFEQVYKNKNAADQLRAKAAIDAANDARTAAREEARDNRLADREDTREERRAKREADNAKRQHEYKIEELAKQEGLKLQGLGKAKKAELQGEIELARENGVPDDEIRALVRRRLGGDQHKKTTAPEERRALVRSDLMKNDMKFPTDPPEVQQRKIDDAMRQIDGAGGAPAAAGGGAQQFQEGRYSKQGDKVYVFKDGKLTPFTPPAR
jgi:hypothetical protein